MHQGGVWARACKALLLWTLAVSGCQFTEAEPAESFRTASDLVQALEKAGVELTETANAARPEFGAPGRVFQTGDGELHVFEFNTSQARREAAGTISSDGGIVRGHTVDWPHPAHIWAVDRVIVVYAGTDGGVVLTLMGLLGDPLTGQRSEPGEPFPPAVVEAIRWLAAEQGGRPEEVEVLRFEPAEWTDACLGLGRADEGCLAVITPGFRVFMRLGSREYTVHTNEMGDQVRLAK